MYEAFFGLKERPVESLLDPRNLYLAPRHQQVLSKCQHMISDKSRPRLRFGPIGSRKIIGRRIYQQLHASQAEGREFESRLQLQPDRHDPPQSEEQPGGSGRSTPASADVPVSGRRDHRT